MVTRIGHMGLRVRDLEAAVAFQQDVIGMVQTERTAGAAYLTCNERHHELILVQDPTRRGYDHIGLEVPDARALEEAKSRVRSAGGIVLGDVYDGEPGIDRALRIQGPGGHVFKLFCGMQTGPALESADRPTKFEHVSVKTPRPGPLEQFLKNGLGFRFSDRMGSLASWWHCDSDHHGMAIVWAPKNELSHYAYSLPDLTAIGKVCDRLRQSRSQKLIWGISRHGPGSNHFAYFHDHDGAMVELCSDLAQMPPDGDYQARKWPVSPDTINQWGCRPPLKFLLTGYPIVEPDAGYPAWATRPDRDAATVAGTDPQISVSRSGLTRR